MRASGALWEEAPMLCRRGDMLAALGEAQAAEAAWREALRVATAQEARLFVLRAVQPLSLRLARTGRAAEARARGPLIGTVSRPQDRNVIGSHGGSYAVYRALAV